MTDLRMTVVSYLSRSSSIHNLVVMTEMCLIVGVVNVVKKLRQQSGHCMVDPLKRGQLR